ncbi:MAG: hypothetical protein MJ196_01320 [Treponemataceae bacterium]|nr:hypothetical protein [Treponemataceae bacterium]
MTKKTAIVTGGTAKDAAAMAVLALNIKETNPNLTDEMVIFHDGISKKDQQLMQKIMPCRFIFYKSPFEKPENFDKNVLEYFSPMVFCKYECFKLLNEYETVIWTDYDVLICKDLSNLTDFGGKNYIKMCQGPDNFRFQFNDKFDQTKYPQYNWNEPNIHMNLFALSDKIQNAEKIYSECIRLTNELAPFILCPEQAILQMVMADEKLSYTPLAFNIYSVRPCDIPSCPDYKILHTFAQPKFWNGINHEKWENYYTQWRKMGGCKHLDRFTPFERKIYRLKKKIRKIFSSNK